MIEIKYFDERGNFDGRLEFADHAITTDAMECAEDVFRNFGHAEVWRDDIRPNDTPATTLEELTDRFAEAVSAEDENEDHPAGCSCGSPDCPNMQESHYWPTD